jgi:hypothetical protein
VTVMAPEPTGELGLPSGTSVIGLLWRGSPWL